MFTNTLSPNAARALALLGDSQILKGAYLASLEDIAAMKIAAICDRGSKRDFIDLYFLVKKFSLKQIFKFYDQKYAKFLDNRIHILKSISYFADADTQKDPKMLISVSWEEVKQFFQNQAILLAKENLKI